MILIQILINGIMLGGFYATMALGFSTIWGVMRLINLAHGEFLLMGAFVAWFFFNPTREQSLSLSSDDPTLTLIAMGATGLVIGFMLGENLLKQFIRQKWQKRAAGAAAGLVAAGILYVLWQSQDFITIDITMMFIVLAGLALGIGFMISHIILGTMLQRYTLTTRRLIGYGAGVALVVPGYLLWRGAEFPPIDPFLSLPMVFILFFGFGYILQKGFLNRLVEGPYLTMLLVTFAIAIILQNVGLMIYAADPKKINIEYGGALSIAEDLTIAPARILTLIIAVVMMSGLVFFLRYTRIGYAIRAAAQNKMAARLMGINIAETYALTFAISLGLTAMAGGMMGTFQPVSAVNGPIWTLRAFAIVALGGLGKVEGVIVGGLVLGVLEALVGWQLGIGWGIAVSFVLLVVMLVLRPQGITGGLVPVED